MVKFTTNGRGIITNISAGVKDDIVIPDTIGLEKIEGLSNDCMDYKLRCRSFSSATEFPLKIKRNSLGKYLTASGNIDLRNVDFSGSTLIDITLQCKELILPSVQIKRPANIDIDAVLVNLSSEFSFIDMDSPSEYTSQSIKIGTLNVLGNNNTYFHKRRSGWINKVVLFPEVSRIEAYAFFNINIEDLVWSENIVSVFEHAFDSSLHDFPSINFSKVAVGECAFRFARLFFESGNRGQINLTGLKSIPYGLFFGSYLENVDIILDPNVRNIEDSAFYLDDLSEDVCITELNCVKTRIEHSFYNIDFNHLVLSPSLDFCIHNSLIRSLSFVYETESERTANADKKYYMHDCTIEQADFSNLDLSRIKFLNCVFNHKVDLFILSQAQLTDYAFEGCKFLSDVILPLSLNKINSFSFKSAIFVGKIILPDYLKEICFSAFKMAIFSENIVFPGSLAMISDTAFNNAVIRDGKFKKVSSVKLPDLRFGEIC